MRIGPICSSMVSNQVVAAAEVAPVKQLVRLTYHHRFIFFLINFLLLYISARVAAGAIAEKFLRIAYGVEIVAFVSGVGPIHLSSKSFTTAPVNGNGATHPHDDEDYSGPEYLQFLSNITRETVDKSVVRCPHEATAERMIEVSLLIINRLGVV